MAFLQVMGPERACDGANCPPHSLDVDPTGWLWFPSDGSSALPLCHVRDSTWPGETHLLWRSMNTSGYSVRRCTKAMAQRTTPRKSPPRPPRHKGTGADPDRVTALPALDTEKTFTTINGGRPALRRVTALLALSTEKTFSTINGGRRPAFRRVAALLALSLKHHGCSPFPCREITIGHRHGCSP